MKAIIVDISGKVGLYDQSLYEAIRVEAANDSIKLATPGKGLFSLVPKRYGYSENLLKRFIKVAEGLLNYAYICIRVQYLKIDVLHLQWLPFMEFVGWEIPILKFLKCISPKIKLVLTIHNIYPHNMTVDAKKSYNARFRKVCMLFDAFIVHTKISKEDVVREFGLKLDSVYICCHGVFEPQGVTVNSGSRKNGKLRILQFGAQSFYKGTDLLVDAICGLDDERKSKIDTYVVGNINQSFLDELKAKDKDSVIQWKAYFLNKDELYQEINDSDLIVLPYRAISQSGVLLLSIYFGKLIICSDLPSFKETIKGDADEGLDDIFFFKSEDAGSLRNILIKYIDGNIDENVVRKRIQHLKTLYSWESAAKATLDVYRKIIITYPSS